MCSSRKTPKQKFSYAPSASPWNKHVLLGLWITELILTIAVSVVGGALVPSKLSHHRYDDGISDAFYFIILMLVASLTVLNLIFLGLQFIWYRKNTLHPRTMVIFASVNMFFWLAVMCLALVTVTMWSAERWEVYEVVEFFYFLTGFIFMAHLGYAGSVYRRWRKNRRRSADAELQDAAYVEGARL